MKYTEQEIKEAKAQKKKKTSVARRLGQIFVLSLLFVGVLLITFLITQRPPQPVDSTEIVE